MTDVEIKLVDTILRKINEQHPIKTAFVSAMQIEGAKDVYSLLKEYHLIEDISEMVGGGNPTQIVPYIKITPTGHKVLRLNGGFKEYLDEQAQVESRAIESVRLGEIAVKQNKVIIALTILIPILGFVLTHLGSIISKLEELLHLK
jgi:hypothetical protein